MPFYRVGNTMMHVKFGGKLAKKPPAPCCANVEINGRAQRCMAMSAFLCDWPVDGGTCDAPLCADHAHQVAADRHYCPRHRGEQLRTQPGLF
jgi:hypothetical protein